MVNLWIDNQLADVDTQSVISITLGISSIGAPDSSTGTFSKGIDLPITDANRYILGYPEQVLSTAQFNNANHKARVEVDGTTVMTGRVTLAGVTRGINGAGVYRITITGDDLQWVTAAKAGTLTEALPTQSVEFSNAMVIGNSLAEGADLLRFVPVERGSQYDCVKLGGEEVYLPRARNAYDYLPFFNVWRMMERIFAGYTIDAPAIRSRLETLYCSGAYDTAEVQAPEYDKFKAGMKHDAVVTGTVGNQWSGIMGNPFGSVDAYDNDEYFNGGGLTITPAVSTYRPQHPRGVGFKLLVSGTSEVRLITGNEYRPQAIVVVDEMQLAGVHYPLFPTIDRTPVTAVKRSHDDRYLLIDDYFGLNPAWNAYRHTVWVVDDEGEYTQLPLVDSFEHGLYTVESGIAGQLFVRYYYTDTNQAEVHADVLVKDVQGWAKRCYYVPESYTTGDFSAEINTLPTYIESSLPLMLEFRCSELIPASSAGLSLAIEDNTMIGTEFPALPALGQTVDYVDLLKYDAKQIDLIAAVRQMFNLLFYVNDISKVVYISPRKDFYDHAVVVDWSDRIDMTGGVEIEELGGDIGGSLTMSYKESAVSKAYSARTGKTYAEKTWTLDNAVSDMQTKTANALFAPAIVKGRVIVTDEPDAPCYPLTAKLNPDVPTVAQYTGNLQGIPHMLFDVSSMGMGYSLRFDGPPEDEEVFCEGNIGEQWDGDVRSYNTGRRITASVRLYPYEVEGIIFPSSSKRDFRALYKLSLWGEVIYCHLEKISDYNPANGGTTRCQFITVEA